jgi:PD-(D/E)XK nuclease superfamily protein
MSPPILTASAFARTLACTASAVLPRVRTPASDAAERGTALHLYLQRALEVGPEAALEEVPAAYREECEGLEPLALLGPGDWRAEVALAFDPRTGVARHLGANRPSRSYEDVLPGEVAGTVDALCVTEDAVLLADWKSGRAEHVEPAARNAQLRFYALLAASYYGKATAHVQLVHLPEGGRPFVDTAVLDALDLDAAEDELARTVAAVEEARAAYRERGVMPDATLGDHCRHCPAWASCPARGALIRSAVAAPETVAKELSTPLTPEMVALAYVKIRAVRAALGHYEAAINAYASQVPVPLGGGLVLGLVESEREELDGAAVRRLVAERFGQEAADEAVEWSASKKALKDALRAHAPRGQLAALERQVLEELRAAGAVTRRATSAVREHRPRPAEEPPALTDADALGK